MSNKVSRTKTSHGLARSSSDGPWAALVGVAGGALANGELFEMKVAIDLGRSIQKLKDLAAASMRYNDKDSSTYLTEKNSNGPWAALVGVAGGALANGELFEMKVAIDLGRSIQELKDLAAASMRYNDKDSSTFTSEELAGRLF
ncbi:hypothetical protein MRB53_007563 [Persea americana]|uniref:Uncharacterized protein n=1 Tax=Persea americana TaxID=3435 RepID=A0ACC2MK73_PERAE|nr:hypothetical protein MRB53_007563 [Persea americana]